MNNAIYLTIVLQLAGILVIIAEIIIPSGGILGILAAGLIGYSLYLVFSQVSATAGMVFVMADLAIIPVVNKIDLPSARPDEIAQEICDLLGGDPNDYPAWSLIIGFDGRAKRVEHNRDRVGKLLQRFACRQEDRLVAPMTEQLDLPWMQASDHHTGFYALFSNMKGLEAEVDKAAKAAGLWLHRKAGPGTLPRYPMKSIGPRPKRGRRLMWMPGRGKLPCLPVSIRSQLGSLKR